MTNWRKSTSCSWGDCCWVRRDGDHIVMADRVPHHLEATQTTQLRFTLDEWRAFVEGVRDGQFDELLQAKGKGAEDGSEG